MEEVHWKDEIIECLKELGGIGSLDQILERVIARGRVKVGSRTPKKTISQTLQIHSLSTRYGTDHTFYSVYGVNSKRVFGDWWILRSTISALISRRMTAAILKAGGVFASILPGSEILH